MDYVWRTWEFSTAVASYWYWWVTAVPFLIDQLLSRNFWPKTINERISTFWPEESRHRVFKCLALVGFVISCFLAFDHVNFDLKEKTKETLSLQGQLKTTKNQLAETQRAFVEAQRQTAPKNRDSAKVAFDIGGSGDIAVKKAQLCGEMTVVRSQPGSSGSFKLEDFTGIAPDTKCSFPPPTEVMKGFSNNELKQRVAAICEALDTFQKNIDDQTTIGLNDGRRRELDKKATEDFKSHFLEQAMQLNNAIAARVGWVEIPDSKPNEKNIMKAQTWSTLTRHGRATLIFGKPVGLAPATGVGNYLSFIAEKLPD